MVEVQYKNKSLYNINCEKMYHKWYIHREACYVPDFSSEVRLNKCILWIIAGDAVLQQLLAGDDAGLGLHIAVQLVREHNVLQPILGVNT